MDLANETILDIAKNLCDIADNMKAAANTINHERMEYEKCRIHPHCFRHLELLRQAQDMRNLAARIMAAYKREMDEAAEHINCYLQEISANPEPHNWLIRNGYKDESYQECLFGQEIVKEDTDNAKA
jgi:hypothetical protein